MSCQCLIRDKLSKKLNGKREVECSSGIIDIITDEEIIEVKNIKNWKHAIGQIISYELDYINKQKRIISQVQPPEY